MGERENQIVVLLKKALGPLLFGAIALYFSSRRVNIPFDPARSNQPAVSRPAFQPTNTQRWEAVAEIIGKGFREKVKRQR